MDSFLVEAIGWIGTLVFLLGLYLVSSGWVDGTGIIFNIMMLAQSAIFIVYSLAKDVKPYVFVEVVLP